MQPYFVDDNVIILNLFLHCYNEQEKELLEKHNAWLNEELSAKVNSLVEERKTHMEIVADMSAKLADVSVLILMKGVLFFSTLSSESFATIPVMLFAV